MEQNITAKKYTARDFLDKYFEFYAKAPDKDFWNIRKIKPKSLYYRFMELNSFLDVFNIGNDLDKDFRQLNFLNTRKAHDFDFIINDVKDYIIENNLDVHKVEFIDRFKDFDDAVSTIEYFLSDFMYFIEDIYLMLYKDENDIIYEDDDIIKYSTEKVNNVTQKIFDDLSELKNIIARVIDPSENEFTREFLIKNYGFPDVDINQLEHEERMNDRF